MGLKTDITDNVAQIYKTEWNTRAGQVVPVTEDVVLSNGAVTLDAVLLYADLAHSTELVRKLSRGTAAKLVRAYLSSMSRVIRARDGHIRSFDGDRVMGVFVGGKRNTNAAKCALQMHYVLREILRPQAATKFPSHASNGLALDHCVGVASGTVTVVRSGIRGSNDLVFVGDAPNFAAKLSGIRNATAKTYITAQVYKDMLDETRLASDGRNMWTAVNVTLAGESWPCYKSGWTWSIG
jgi:adenylate cyclase